jgi:hypothetical protein
MSAIKSSLLPTAQLQELTAALVAVLPLNHDVLENVVISSATVASEQRVFFEQREAIQKGIDSKLKKLKTKAFKEGFTSNKKVFISYAWPIENVPEEKWTKEFVFNLATHLEIAGFEVILDRKQSNCGSPVLEFMRENIRTADHVIIVCNRTMQYKFEEDGGSGVMFEYLESINRWRKEKPVRFIIPLCLTKDNYIPGLVGKFAAVSPYEDGYLDSLKELISRIYGFENIFDDWWDKCIKPLVMPQDKNDAHLSLSLAKHSVMFKPAAMNSTPYSHETRQGRKRGQQMVNGITSRGKTKIRQIAQEGEAQRVEAIEGEDVDIKQVISKR